MTVLQNTVAEPNGTPLDGWVDIEILGNPFQAGTQTELLGALKDHPIVDGAWAVDLVPGLYKVTQRRRDGLFHSRWTAQVPASESPVWLADCLVEVPGTPAGVPLLGVASTLVDESGHLVLTYTDGSTVDAGPVVGPQGPPYTGSPVEFDAAAVAAIEVAATVAPTGVWDFAEPPMVDGVPVGSTVPAASTTTPGIIEIATAAETNNGLDDTLAVTPARLAEYVDQELGTIPPNPDLSKVPVWIYQASGGTWPARTTVTNDATRPVEWIGYPGRTDAPASGGSGAVVGVDFYRRRDPA